MRAKMLGVVCGLAAGLAAGTAVGQPQKLYIWGFGNLSSPSSDVIDASLGGGAENFTWGVYLDSSRVLHGIGNNQWGQHGYKPSPDYSSPCNQGNHPEYCYLPELVNGVIPGLRRVSAGWDHNLGLSDDSIYWRTRGLIGWGKNEKGQCVAPMWDSNGNPVGPWNIDANAKVTDISAGEFVNIVLFDNGQVAAWGHTLYGVNPPSNGIPGSGAGDPYIPPANWRFKKVAAGGHFVMALILDAPGSGLYYDEVTGRTGEGWIVTWGTFDYGGFVARGPGFRGYTNGNPTLTSPVNNGDYSPIPTPVYTPPYDDIFAGHVVCGGIIKSQSAYHKQHGIEVRPGTVHMWANDSHRVLSDQPSHLTFEQVVGGYSQFAEGVALLDYTDPEDPVGVFTIQSWGGPTTSGAPPLGYPTGVVVNQIKMLPNPNRRNGQMALCYDPNCDGSTGTPALTANDFQCFADAYAAAQQLPWAQQVTSYANCDGSTGNPAVTANDFICFTNKFVNGPCP